MYTITNRIFIINIIIDMDDANPNLKNLKADLYIYIDITSVAPTGPPPENA